MAAIGGFLASGGDDMVALDLGRDETLGETPWCSLRIEGDGFVGTGSTFNVPVGLGGLRAFAQTLEQPQAELI